MKGRSVNTTFNPSTFDKQAAASLDMLDEQAAAKRVQQILHPEDDKMLNPTPRGIAGAQAGPTLTPQPQTQPQAPAPRKKRSDAGIPKKAPADPDEIVLKLSAERIMDAALILSQTSQSHTAMLMLMQMNVHLQKKIDALSKGK